MDIIHVFAHNVRTYRKALGLSQEAFAHNCGLHRTYISSVEREQRSVSLKNIGKIADALGIEPYLLFVDAAAHESKTPKKAPEID